MHVMNLEWKNPGRHPPVQRRRWYRVITVLTLIAFWSACTTWKAVPLTQIEAGTVVEPKAKIRVTRTNGERVVLVVDSLSFPNVTGTEIDAERYDPATGVRGTRVKTDTEGKPSVITVDLRQVQQVEVLGVSGWRTLLLAIGVIIVIAGIAALVVALTKTSCPLAYVDTGKGPELVGEVYSGATSRAVQRDDLMPLPPLGDRASVILSNEAQEIQFTDLAELVLVEHAPGVRAVATHDAGLLLFGQATPPVSAVNLEGADVADLVRDRDARLWATDLSAASHRPQPPQREGLVLSFRRPAGNAPLALELEAGNTAWLDLVMGRFFALLGDQLEGYLDQADQADAREPTLAWREREGVDLRVEVERAGRWERVAVVPTVGPVSLRHFGVPLPPVEGDVVRVRLSSGVGFWQVDRVALASVESRAARQVRLAPIRAIQSDGTDARAALASTDGKYQVLPKRGTLVRLDFELQPPGPGLVRDAFLHTSGYYRVIRPPSAELSKDTLYRLRDEPGSLSRFSLDLYRGYEEAAAAMPVSGPR
jgi:hypothetical protein